MSGADSATQTLDWSGMMRAGLHGLGLNPREFWALTPVELMVMLGREQCEAAHLGRAGLERLIARFPDRTRDPEHPPAARQTKDEPHDGN